MEFIREVINSDRLETLFFIPESLKHRNVEVLILPIEEKTEKSAAGILGKYANPSLIEKESEAWEMAVKEKYGNS